MPPLAPDRTPEGWSRVAEQYEVGVAPFSRQYAADALRLAGVKSGERVLDVAAGSGSLTFLAADAGAQVLATDFAPAMIDVLRKQATKRGHGRVQAEVMDGQALALPDAGFDAAFSIFGLIFFPDRARGFRELHRVVKPGGRVAVAAWGPADRLEFLTLFGGTLKQVAPDLPPPAEPPAILSLSNPDAFAREMTDAGFRNVRIHQVTHAYTGETPEAFWDAATRASPVLPPLIAGLGPERARRFHEAILARLTDRFGDGPISLASEANIGVATR